MPVSFFIIFFGGILFLFLDFPARPPPPPNLFSNGRSLKERHLVTAQSLRLYLPSFLVLLFPFVDINLKCLDMKVKCSGSYFLKTKCQVTVCDYD